MSSKEKQNTINDNVIGEKNVKNNNTKTNNTKNQNNTRVTSYPCKQTKGYQPKMRSTLSGAAKHLSLKSKKDSKVLKSSCEMREISPINKGN